MSIMKNYINLMPGDNCFPAEEISKMIKDLNGLDLVMSIPKEINDSREKHRKFFSRAFTIIVNVLFGYNIKYYNGIPIVKTQIIKKLDIKSKSPFFMAEIVLKILKLKLKYDEREIYFIERKFGKTGIFNLKTIFKTMNINVRVIGLDKLDRNADYIFAPNHASSLDIPLILGFLPFWIVPISKIELKCFS